jgi:predicted dehydrogenase/threonine dehydrogenase-like Zn-dependent dehydrogenase
MQQVIRKGIKQIIVEEVPEPMVAPHQVLIRPVCSLISSGTETASIHQAGMLKLASENPAHLLKIWEVAKVNGPLRTFAEVRAKFSDYAVIGYAGAGIVVDKHPNVTELKRGDRVAYGGEGTGHAEIISTGRNLVARVPDTVPFESACFATLGSIALNAVRIAKLSLGDTVAIIGLGLVGQLIAQLARLQGGVVIATDLKPGRVELGRLLGAHYGLIIDGSPQDGVASITGGRGADCVIVAAAAKSSNPCRQALQMCRDRGRLVIVGAVEMTFPWNEMYLKEIQLFMSRAYGPGSYDPLYEKQGQDYPISHVRWTEKRNIEEFLRLLAAGLVQVQPLITHQFSLAEAPNAYQTILDPAANSLAVLLKYAEPGSTIEPKRKVELWSRPSEKDELGVALIGSGGLARWEHLPNLKKIPHVKLRAIHSTSGARGKSYALRFGAAYCCTDYEAILKDPQIDVVLITSRNQLHADQAVRALRAGKNVFVEKPMALTEDECRALNQAVQESGRQLTVGFNRRFAPFYATLKKQLSRRNGPAVLNCSVNSPGFSGNYWAADPAIGGAILGEACHFMDLMYWLLESEPVKVAAFSLPMGRQAPIGENNLVSSFHFADGSIGNLTYCTVGSKTSGGERVEAFAQDLGIKTENFKRLTVETSFRRTQKHLWAQKGYASQLSSFLQGIREGRQPEVTVRDGTRATIGCLRMLESARTQTPVSIDMDAALLL